MFKHSRLWLRRSVNAVFPYNSLNLTVLKRVPMALKIVYKICCGIDVHKTFVVACVASTSDKGITSYESHRFSTYTSGLKTLLQWLIDRNCKDVCMESTSKYWIPVYNILEKGCSIVLAHPKYVKAIRGKKTDKKDAKWIADLFKHDLVAGSFMPPSDIRQLRDLMRYRFKLTCFKSSEKNRLQNCLTVSNIQLGNVVSDTFGKSAQAILDKLLENPADTSFDLEPLVYKSLKKNRNGSFSYSGKLSKVLLRMKLTFVLLLCVMSQVFALASAQTVSLKKQNASLEEILWELKEKTQLVFMYSDEDIASVKGIDIDMKNTQVDAILNKCLEGTDLKYVRENNAIVIRRSRQSENVPQVRMRKISGKVTDTSGDPLPGVTILVDGTTIGVATDNEGKIFPGMPRGA